jgi:thiol-disulfide isomerase/thioredoxin
MAMMRRRTVLVGATALAAGTVAAALALRKLAEPAVYTPIGEGAGPAVHLQDLSALVPTDTPRSLSDITILDAQGKPHYLAEFAGHPVLLNLWATWCAPCVAELPSLATLARNGAKEGLIVLPVSTDRGGAPVVQRFYQSHGITGLDVWLDPKGEALEALAARGVPTTLLIDRAGRERARLEGAADWASPAALVAINKLTG